MSRTARAYWAIGPGRGELREVELGAPGTGEVLVRTLHSGVSRGTEALVAAGRVPESQWTAMRAPFQEGEFPFPVKYGYASVGLIEAGEPALLGRTVFCLYPHQTAYVVPAAAVAPLPGDVPPARAVLAANMETALNAVWDGGARPGQRIHVIGAGVVGCLVAYVCARLPGAETTLADVLPERAALAEALGARFARPEELADGADLVFHASGRPEGLGAALRTAGFEATIVELSWYGTTAVPLPLGEAFHSRRLQLVSSQVGLVASEMRPRWSHARRLAKALELLRDPAFDRLVRESIPFAGLPGVLPHLGERADALCLRIDYGDAG